MKRLWITLLIIAMAVAITVPAGAGDINCDDEELKPYTPDHPACNTPDTTTTSSTTIPAGEECEFDADGILENSWSEADGPYRCRWTPSNRGPFTFHLTAGSADDDGSVLRPHMFVTDSYPYGEFVNDSSPYGDKCFDDMDNGWHDLKYLLEDEDSYAWESFSLPADGECDDSFPEVDPDGADVFSLVIAVRIKGTTPVVTVTQP